MSKIEDQVGYKVTVSGLVQGVGFRYFTANEAHKLAIVGHAKNLTNGDVEVVMYGGEPQVLSLVKWLETGPQSAIVERLDIQKIPFSQEKCFQSL